MRDMLLPRNVQRRQWVNRNFRIKEILNVAGLSLCCTELKLNEEVQKQTIFKFTAQAVSLHALLRRAFLFFRIS